MCGASGVALLRRSSIAAVRPEGIRTLAFSGGNRNPTLYPPRFLLPLFLVLNGFGGQAELEVVDGDGSTALHYAAQRGVCSLLFLWRLYIAVAVVRFCIV